ncbi:MAG: DUF4395 domain-containing protein [Ferruginibacter sp.]
MSTSNIVCPVDFVMINEQKIRLTAGSIFVLAITFLVTQFWIIPFFLVLDFFARAFNLARFSLLNRLSDQLIKLFAIGSKLADQAPKRFAARIGFFFSAAILISLLLNLSMVSLAITVILAVFALLEAAFGFCAGCHVYSFYTRFLKKGIA